MKKEFFSTATIVGTKLVLNPEAIETMDLDTEGAKVILIETTNVEHKKQPKEILIIKTNGSLCDDLENIKDVFPPDHIRTVAVKNENGEIVSGSIDLNQDTVNGIKAIFGKDKDEFKLLACNIESPLGKEFKEQFDISNIFYRFAYITDKRNSIGKEKNVKETTEERVSIN
jgi:hypothetical protein